eukprot:2897938-Rhodomonas_salina.1
MREAGEREGADQEGALAAFDDSDASVVLPSVLQRLPPPSRTSALPPYSTPGLPPYSTSVLPPYCTSVLPPY